MNLTTQEKQALYNALLLYIPIAASVLEEEDLNALNHILELLEKDLNNDTN